MTGIQLPPPPRRVRGLIAGGGEAWFGRIFTLPHTLIGIGTTAYWVLLWLWTFFGTDLRGVVTGVEIHHSSKGGTSYSAKYRYVVGTVTKSGSGGVSQADYERFKSQDDLAPEVTVRYFSIGLWEHAELQGGSRLWAGVGGFTLWIAFWDGAIGLFVYMLWVKPLRVRWLYKYGQATSGILTGKRARRGKGTTYYVSYAFKDPLSGAEMKKETEVWKSQDWDDAEEGQPITVLYAPENPERSTVYEFGGYRVDLDNG